ncbi:hypothetical protein L1987_29138 [Smallanthus sonchifolius]|uniref:Uncharacterized protein n=1 Tax=Smallanthus sonchifolius TaxID=185202 RepID=A0ACB9HZ20_9ASTR|nr:hypothetical protein L1987_29138 [Smallanthus sonchifolius]
MLGLSYGELFLLLGATAALIGPKDLPRIARVAGRLAGRSIGYVQMARGQFDNVMQQSQAKQVHKELQDTIAQLEAIRHEIRTISFVNPGPLTRRLVENGGQIPETNGNTDLEKTSDGALSEPTPSLPTSASKVYNLTASPSSNMHSQATAYARLAESAALRSEPTSNGVISELTDESGITVLPVSAQETGLLPNRKADAKGSDIMLESILEAEIARNAKDFFAQPQNVIKSE